MSLSLEDTSMPDVLVERFQDVLKAIQTRLMETQSPTQTEMLEEVQNAVKLCHQEVVKLITSPDFQDEQIRQWSFEQIIHLLQEYEQKLHSASHDDFNCDCSQSKSSSTQ